MPSKNMTIYTGLANIYNDLMADIDYDEWTDFIDEIIQTHHETAETLLELACGTGNHAFSFEELEAYSITATDASAEMLEIAKLKANFRDSNIRWHQMDFRNIDLQETFDVILCLFDSINYLLQPKEVVTVFNGIHKALNPNGIFIFDFATPINSETGAEAMNAEGTTTDNFRYVRKSYYLPSERLHYNEFEIDQLSEDKKTVLKRFRETHKQRIYTFSEMKKLVEESSLSLLAAYEDYDLDPASEKSHRITMVLQ